MNNWKWGGVAALVAAATVVVGLGLFATVVADYASGDLDAGESVAFLVDNQAVLYVWDAITLIGFSIVLVPLALALNRRLKAGSPALAQTATGFALIWAGLLMAAGMVINIGSGTVVDLSGADSAQAETVWLTVDTVGNGLSGGMEIAGPLWVFLISTAALSSGALPKPLNYVGIVIAAAGLLTIVPALELIGALFGLGLIVWLTWLGIVMLRDDATQPV